MELSSEPQVQLVKVVLVAWPAQLAQAPPAETVAMVVLVRMQRAAMYPQLIFVHRVTPVVPVAQEAPAAQVVLEASAVTVAMVAMAAA